jgi:hypothetical protein
MSFRSPQWKMTFFKARSCKQVDSLCENTTVGVALRTVILMELPADASLCVLIPLALVEAPIHWNKDAARASLLK